jgi:hypothetical protein
MYKVTYDWVLEYTDQYGDIQECEYYDTLKQIGVRSNLAPQTISGETCAPVIGLHRGLGDEIDGYQDRTYAYPETDTLPERFQDGEPVPKRFQKELTKWWAK